MARRVNVSAAMRRTPFVRELTDLLGERLEFTTDPVLPGFLKADAISPRGFSLRVNRGGSSRDTASLLNISGSRRGKVEFPPQSRLQPRLPHRTNEVDAYMKFLYELGLRDICEISARAKPALCIDRVRCALEGLSAHVLALA